MVILAVLDREFASWPVDVEAEVGDAARFSCWINSVPEAEISWERDGQALPSAVTQDADFNTLHSRFDTFLSNPTRFRFWPANSIG